MFEAHCCTCQNPFPYTPPGREYLEGHNRRPDAFIGCTNCPQSLPNADPVNKGINNTNQLVLNPNPTNPLSAFRILSVVRRGMNFMVAMWQAAGIRTDVVQATAGEATGGYSSNVDDITGAMTTPSTDFTFSTPFTHMANIHSALFFPPRDYAREKFGGNQPATAHYQLR